MKKIIIFGFILLLFIPTINAFESYGLGYVNVCNSGIHYYYCDEAKQRGFGSHYGRDYFLDPQWTYNIEYKDITPKRRGPLHSNLYKYPLQTYIPGTFTKWARIGGR